MFQGAVLIGPLIEADPEVATPIMKGMAKLLGSVVPWLPLRGLDLKEVTRDEEAGILFNRNKFTLLFA